MKVKTRLKKYEELCSKIRNLIRSIIDNSYEYYEKYVKIKNNLCNDLPLNKMLKLHNMVIIVRYVFHKGNKYYPQVFLNKCLYKLSMLYNDRIGGSERIDINKTILSKKCDICHYWYFLDKTFEFQQYVGVIMYK